MKIYKKIRALFSNFNSKIIRGISFCKFLPSVQMIDQKLRIEVLKCKVVLQNMVAKSKNVLIVQETLCDSAITY